MSLLDRDRLIVGTAAALAVAVPVALLWPQAPELHEQAARSVTALPPVSLALTGAVTAAPLFNPDRSPTPASGADAAGGAAAPAPPAPPPTLVGIAAGKGGAVVLLKTAGGETVQAAAGEEIEGWRVVSIARDHALVEQGGRRENLGFDFNNKPLPAAGPSAGPPVPPPSPPVSLSPPLGRPQT